MTLTVAKSEGAPQGKHVDPTTQAVSQAFAQITELFAKGVQRVEDYGTQNVKRDFGTFASLPSLHITAEDKIDSLHAEAKQYADAPENSEFNSWGSPTNKVPELRKMWASFRHWRYTSVDAGKTIINVGKIRMMSTFFTAAELNAINDEIIRIGNLIGFSKDVTYDPKPIATTLLDRNGNTDDAATAATRRYYGNELPVDAIDEFVR